MNIFKKIKLFFANQRIIEVDGRFIPQVRTRSSPWAGISKDFTTELWHDFIIQTERCAYDTYAEANEAVLRYLDRKKRKEIKYHEISHEPAAWRILKSK